MVILHIASISGNPYSGVSIAVPQHVRAQAQWADVGFLNVQGGTIPGMAEQITVSGYVRLDVLPGVFSKPDLVVFHNVYWPAFLPIARQLRKQGIPYVIVPHGCLRREAQQRKWLKKKLGNLLLFNRFIRGAVAIQCLSELELAETKFPGRKFVGTNGIAIPDVCKKGFQKQGIQIAFIGRLEVRVKGLDLLMEALRMKADYLRQAHCRMTICGPDHAGGKWELEELIRKYALEDIVSLQNAVSGPEKEGVLLEQDIFLLTSRHEGMPLGVLEAMSYGLPCILTEGTNLRGFVEENNAGWGAENTAESIAEAILRAVNERDLWQEKSANARAAVRQAFDWDVVAERTVEVYRSLVKE